MNFARKYFSIILKVLQEWTKFWNMSLGLIFWIVMQNFAVITMSRSREKWRLKLLLWLFSGYSRTEIVTSILGDGRPDVTLWDCTSCNFCKRKTRGETQFWIELAAPCTLAIHNEINSDDTLPFIIFLTPVFCDGSNRLCRQRLLLSPCSLWHHKQTLFGVIRPLAAGNADRFAESLNDIVFIDISAFTAYLHSDFLYIVLYEQSDHIVLKVYSF